MRPGAVTVTVLRAPAVDAWGDPIGNSVEVPSSDWALAPTNGTETDDDNRNEHVERLTAYVPESVVVSYEDRVRLPDGTTWRVLGSPERWHSLFTGRRVGAVVQLERVVT